MNALLTALLKPFLTLLAAWSGGRVAGRNAAKVEELKDYVEISKKIGAVNPVDPDAAAEWLRRRAERQRDL